MPLDLANIDVVQHELALDAPPEDRGRLMAAMDSLNSRFGRGTVTAGSAGTGGPRRRWVMRKELKTPNYTTEWGELPIVRA